MSKFRLPAALALLACTLAGCIGGPPTGSEAPHFSGTAATGETITLAEFEGDVLVLDFFATW